MVQNNSRFAKSNVKKEKKKSGYEERKIFFCCETQSGKDSPLWQDI